jgi:hypothetical protein
VIGITKHQSGMNHLGRPITKPFFGLQGSQQLLARRFRLVFLLIPLGIKFPRPQVRRVRVNSIAATRAGLFVSRRGTRA